MLIALTDFKQPCTSWRAAPQILSYVPIQTLFAAVILTAQLCPASLLTACPWNHTGWPLVLRQFIIFVMCGHRFSSRLYRFPLSEYFAVDLFMILIDRQSGSC